MNRKKLQMKITKNQLRRIIREAVSTMVNEAAYKPQTSIEVTPEMAQKQADIKRRLAGGHEIKGVTSRAQTQGGGGPAGDTSTVTVQDRGPGGEKLQRISRQKSGGLASDTSIATDAKGKRVSSYSTSGVSPTGQKLEYHSGHGDPEFGGPRLTIDGKEVGMLEPGYMDAMHQLGSPDMGGEHAYEDIKGMATGEAFEAPDDVEIDQPEVTAVNETFKRWKKLIK